MVRMSSNLADLPPDLPPDLPYPVLTSSGQDEFKFGRSSPRSASRSTTPQYWHLVVKMSSNLADLPPADLTLVLTSNGQDEFKFGRSTPRSATRSIFSILISSGQDEFKFGRSIPLQYWHLVVKMSSNLAHLPLDLPVKFKSGHSTS